MSEVIPAPVSIQSDPGNDFVVSPSTVIAVSGAAAVQRAASWLATILRRGTGYAIPIVPATETAHSSIALTLGGAGASLGEEGYHLSVSSAEINIRANTDAGLFYGAQTLRQLLPPAIEAGAGHGTVHSVVPGGNITDHPRYRWRGAMLDVARHFFGVADVKRFIDLLALYKCNVLHLHLGRHGRQLPPRARCRLDRRLNAVYKGVSSVQRSKPCHVAKGFDQCAAPDDNARFAPVANRVTARAG